MDGRLRRDMQMRPVRILHVVTYMGRGGLETMLMNYYRHIDRNKIQFDFLVHRAFEADYDKEIESLGGRIYRLPRLNPFRKEYLNTLDAFFEEHKEEYRIVHSHLDCMAGVPLKYAKKNGIPVRIAHAHNSNQTKDFKYIIKLLCKKNIKMYATDLFACGEEAGRWMFNGRIFNVLNNAIDAEKYLYSYQSRKEVRKELRIADDILVIGHVGRFAPQKNHKFIIKIFSEVLKQKNNAVLLLVGDGELKKDIEELTRNLGIYEKIIFAGVRSDVPRLLQAMDIFLFPSNYEGLPVSIIEAQAAGLPCLISDKVPIECKKTDLVSQIVLGDETAIWVKHILGESKRIRRNTVEEIKKSGFDIIENAKWLEKFYEDKYKNEGRV